METKTKAKPKYNDPIAEAQRYLDNAKNILKENTKIIDGYYSDSKYIKIAGNTVYKGVLIAWMLWQKRKV